VPWVREAGKRRLHRLDQAGRRQRWGPRRPGRLPGLPRLRDLSIQLGAAVQLGRVNLCVPV